MNNWRAFRPAIWLAMLGVALLLLVTPFYFGVVLLGAAMGVAVRIETGRRRVASGVPPRRRLRRRR
jgi:uncharacterized membrane protein